MKRIIIASDFSSAALNATHYAADMGMAVNASVLVLHILHVPPAYAEVPGGVSMEDMIKNARVELREIKKKLQYIHNGKVNIETEMRIGSFFEELTKICNDLKPYAVVMGSQGTTASERIFLGGHTVYAMQHLSWPLITVPPTASFSAIRKIGLACDLKKVLETIPLEEVKLLINDFSAELHVLNTGKEEVFDPEIVFQSGVMAEMLGDIPAKYHFISSKNTEEGILDFVDRNKIDLLIVLPRHHGLMEKIFHKSHTKKLVMHSPTPVLALHQQI